MPKNKVSDPITDQEIAFAHLVFSGTMTDQRAAEAVGLNPATAAYTKSKPCVLAYMLEHRAAVQQQLVEQETEGLRQRNGVREQVLARLWEIAYMSPEMTRGSITGQIKVLSMIVAIEGLIPERVNGRRAGSAESKLAALPTPQIYVSEWLRKQQEKTTGSQPSPDLPNEDQEEDEPGVPELEPVPAPPDRPALTLSTTPANPLPPMPRSSRKRNHGLLPPLLQTPGSPSPSKRTSLAGAADLLKETNPLPIKP